MHLCDLTFSAPEENLACDEALLEACESSGCQGLRFWEPTTYFVVVGYGNRIETEVNVGFCRENRVPILRRSTGGGTVLQGPGCLNYSLILHFDNRGPLSSIQATNGFVLDRHCQALEPLLSERPERQGQTDLTLKGLKFSGNAQRRRKEFLLFHGTFLLNFDLERIGEALPLPSRQPEYRQNRPHREFLANLGVTADAVKKVLARAWSADEPLPIFPQEGLHRLAEDKYGKPEWNAKF